MAALQRVGDALGFGALRVEGGTVISVTRNTTRSLASLPSALPAASLAVRNISVTTARGRLSAPCA